MSGDIARLSDQMTVAELVVAAEKMGLTIGEALREIAGEQPPEEKSAFVYTAVYTGGCRRRKKPPPCRS